MPRRTQLSFLWLHHVYSRLWMGAGRGWCTGTGQTTSRTRAGSAAMIRLTGDGTAMVKLEASFHVTTRPSSDKSDGKHAQFACSVAIESLGHSQYRSGCAAPETVTMQRPMAIDQLTVPGCSPAGIARPLHVEHDDNLVAG